MYILSLFGLRMIKEGLQLLNVSNGNFLSQGEQVVALVHREDPFKRYRRDHSISPA